MPVNCGRRVSGRSNRCVPGWSEGICWAPEVSQAADKVMVTACGPAWSGFSQNRACPLAISAPPDHEVARLDVAVGDPGVPQLADQRQPLVDDRVIDLGLADFGGAGEELGDEQVLTLGGDLDDAVGPGRADPGFSQQVQRVVLVFGQAPHRLEGGFVLQGAVQDGPCPEPATLIPLATSVSHAVRIPAS
jgi:hypothetical protein